MAEFGTHSIDGGTVTSTQSSESLSEAFEKAPETPQEPAGASETVKDGSEAKPAGENAPTPEPVKRKTPRNDMQERMLDATRKESEAKKEAATLKAQNDEIQRRADAAEAELKKFRDSQTAKPTPAASKTELPAKPLLSDFESVEEWEEGVHAWREELRGLKEAEERTAKAKEASEKQFDEVVSTYNDRIKDHLTKSPDFWTKIGDMVNWEPLSILSKRGVNAGDLHPDVMIRAASVDYLLVSENPGPLAEYLSEHPEEFERLKAIHPRRFYGELGRIEERLIAAPTATAIKPKNSNAHLPVRPVTAGSPSAPDSGGLPDPSLSDKEWARRREAKAERDFKSQQH